MKSSIFLCASIVLILALFASPLFSKIISSKDEALKRAFPGASSIERQDFFLTDENIKQVKALAKCTPDSKLFTFYRAENQGKIIGYAYIGTRVIRTKNAVYLVVIRPEATLERVEILAFEEPEEYLPAKRWFDQFSSKNLDENLWPRKGIHAVTGATMSVERITQEVRIVLAVFNVLIKKS